MYKFDYLVSHTEDVFMGAAGEGRGGERKRKVA